MISYLNVKQLEALTEIPKSLVVDCNGEPDGTIYFTKVNKSAVSYYDIIRYLDKFIDDFFADPLRKSLFVIGCYNYLHDVIDGKIKPTKMTEAKAETKPLTLQSATTLAAPPIAPTIPITKTNTVSCSATKTCAAYKPVPQSPAKP